MITKRIIPCLDVRNGRVVKGTNFEGIRDVADPVEMARMYNAAGADELVFYDITASFEGRALFTDILTRVASEIFIPLTVGGGVNTLDDFDRVLKCGADKVSVNSGALRDPSLIPAAAKRYGDQCVVLSADVKRVDGQFRVFAKGGREDTGRDALEWIKWCVDNGAGEVCLNSIDTDGVRNGFDLEMLGAVAGTALALLFGLLAQALTRVDGLRIEDVEPLLQLRQTGTPIGLRGLLVGGIIISALGAVMDVTMGIASSLAEVHAANPQLSRRELFRSGMNIGRDMVGTMTNTLILAFLGSGFTLILYLYSLGLSFRQLMSSAYVSMEVVSGVASSVGVILSIPLTALITAAVFTREKQQS